MGAWIEIAVCRIVIKIVCSRTPRWVRGLKLACVKYNALLGLSHPTMGAWIEIFSYLYNIAYVSSRTPRWVRGLKSFNTLP